MKAKLLSWLWPVVGILSAVAEVIQSVPDYTSLGWDEILSRGFRALPLILIGFVARSNLLKPPPNDDKVV